MRDSITAADIPPGADLVALYIDIATPQDWQRFPGARMVRICRYASVNDGDVLDVGDVGDATPDQLPGWLRMRRAGGAWPSAYCNMADWPKCQQAVAFAGEPQPPWWVANWDNVPMVMQGTVAKQYQGSALTGGHYDQSIVADYWPGIDPVPGPTPPTVTSEPRPDNMTLHTITFTTTPAGQANAGDGWVPTDIPWSSFLAISHRGGYPPVDGYWPGEVAAQDYNGNVLVQFTGGRPGAQEQVFVLSNP